MAPALWNPQDLFDIDPLGSPRTCTAKTKKEAKRCENIVNKADRKKACDLLEELAAVDVVSNGLDVHLRESIAVLAEHTLCKGVHRANIYSQLTPVTNSWCEIVRQYIHDERAVLDDAHRRLPAQPQRAQSVAQPRDFEVAPRQQPQSLAPEASRSPQLAELSPSYQHERDVAPAVAMSTYAPQSASPRMEVETPISPPRRGQPLPPPTEDLMAEDQQLLIGLQAVIDEHQAEEEALSEEVIGFAARLQRELQELGLAAETSSLTNIDIPIRVPVVETPHAVHRHDRKSLTDACYICQEDFDVAAIRQNPNLVCWCATCGTNTHLICNEEWLDASPADRQRCGYCRAPYESGDVRQGLV